MSKPSTEPNRHESFMRPMSGKSVVDRIIDRLTNAILNGDLKPGQKIPTEIELSEAFEVGRNSVREAIKALVTMGVLNIRRSEGTFVAEGFSERMMTPMLYGMVLEGGNTYLLVELRRLFETGILQLAIEKATAEDIKELKKCAQDIERIAKGVPTAEEIQDADIRFHNAMQHSIHNPLVDKFYTIIERMSRPTRILAVQEFIKNGELSEMVAMHFEMIRIIEEHDESCVAAAIEAHFRYWSDSIK